MKYLQKTEEVKTSFERWFTFKKFVVKKKRNSMKHYFGVSMQLKEHVCMCGKIGFEKGRHACAQSGKYVCSHLHLPASAKK